MQSLSKTVCLCLVLATQLNAEATGSLEITGSYFPKSEGESFGTNITAEAKVVGYEDLSEIQNSFFTSLMILHLKHIRSPKFIIIFSVTSID